jgi:ribonuclease BN (tRNA processing enzyme)
VGACAGGDHVTLTRRHLLEGAAVAGLGGLVARTSWAAGPSVSRGRTKVVVLGSHGGQQANVLTGANLRCGTSVLIDVDGVVTVVDCGIGSLHRLLEAGYDANRVRNVLISHHHQDHNADLGNFAGFAWASEREGGPKRRIDIYGPTGTKSYERGYKRLARLSITGQEGPHGLHPAFDRFARWHEVQPPRRPRTLFSTGRFEVSCLRVDHGDIPSLSYRIRTPDLDVVFSGDRGSRDHSSFTGFARGADLLFHEIMDRELVVSTLRAQNAEPEFIRHLVRNHCDPRAVGRAATDAGIRTLALYHLIPGHPAITDEAWRAKLAPHFGGQVIVARDLQVV